MEHAFSKFEIREMKKGFHESRTGRSVSATVGRGSEFGNRQERRRELSSKGLHDNKRGIMIVDKTSRYVSRIQTILVKDKIGFYTGEIRKIQHWDLKK